MDALHAEQRRFETGGEPGADTGQRWPDHDRLGQNRTAPGAATEIDPQDPWRGGPAVSRAGAQAMREMTPDEIRADELLKFAERVNLIRDTSETNQVRQLIRGRLDVLRPQQTRSEEVLDQMTDGRRDPGLRYPGLSYQQAAANGIPINRDQRHVLHGEKLALGIETSAHGDDAYLIPPYQVDQLMAIADGRASWPDVQHDTVEDEPTPPEPPEGLAQLGELLERVTKAQGDINRVGGIEAALQLIRLDLKYGNVQFLSDVDRVLLGSDLADALRGFLRA